MDISRGTALLSLLSHSVGEWLAGETACKRLGVAHTELKSLVSELRAEGYHIEFDNRRGCRYTGREDRIIPREVQRECSDIQMGRHLVVCDVVDSTNDLAWEQALHGAPEGTIVVADEQRLGRGRMGRKWLAPPGSGLLLSLVLRPPFTSARGHALTAMASVAVADTIRDHLAVPARIRWPNDIYVGNRKLAGILVEGRTLATGATFVVGIGINVNLAPEEMPPEVQQTAVSLSVACGKRLDRVELLCWLMHALERWYRDLKSNDTGRIANHWRQLSSTLGHRVALVEDGREVRGTVLDLSMDEGLIVRLDEGLTKIFRPSTVTVRHLCD